MSEDTCFQEFKETIKNRIKVIFIRPFMYVRNIGELELVVFALASLILHAGQCSYKWREYPEYSKKVTGHPSEKYLSEILVEQKREKEFVELFKPFVDSMLEDCVEHKFSSCGFCYKG